MRLRVGVRFRCGWRAHLPRVAVEVDAHCRIARLVQQGVLAKDVLEVL